MIGVGPEETPDNKERSMKVEIVAILKIQQVFHHWIYKHLKTKVQELKKNLHDKAAFEKVLAGKKVDEGEGATRKKSCANAAMLPPEAICSMSDGDVNELDPIIDNPEANLICCMCKQTGERKVNFHIINSFLVKWQTNSILWIPICSC